LAVDRVERCDSIPGGDKARRQAVQLMKVAPPAVPLVIRDHLADELAVLRDVAEHRREVVAAAGGEVAEFPAGAVGVVAGDQHDPVIALD
jgi:hypothetical protein